MKDGAPPTGPAGFLADPFADWSARMPRNPARGGRVPGGVNEHTVYMYGTLWDGWLAWLKTKGVPWDHATAGDMKAFLEGPSPPDRLGATPRDPEHMRRYTANRYLRVLVGVYGRALQQGRVPANPAAVIEAERSFQLKPGDRKIQYLDVAFWHHARTASAMEAFYAPKRLWTHSRDHALAAVLFGTGLASNELVALTPAQIVLGSSQEPLHHDILISEETDSGGRRRAVVPLQDDFFPRDGAPALYVQVLGSKQGSVARSIPLSRAAAQVLARWMGLRLLRGREAGGFDGAKEVEGALFTSSRALASAAEPMDGEAVHHAVNAYLRATWRALCPDKADPRPLGPAVVRNCVVRDWYLTMDDKNAVQYLAGVGATEMLRVREGAMPPDTPCRP